MIRLIEQASAVDRGDRPLFVGADIDQFEFLAALDQRGELGCRDLTDHAADYPANRAIPIATTDITDAPIAATSSHRTRASSTSPAAVSAATCAVTRVSSSAVSRSRCSSSAMRSASASTSFPGARIRARPRSPRQRVRRAQDCGRVCQDRAPGDHLQRQEPWNGHAVSLAVRARVARGVHFPRPCGEAATSSTCSRGGFDGCVPSLVPGSACRRLRGAAGGDRWPERQMEPAPHDRRPPRLSGLLDQRQLRAARAAR